MTSAASTTTNIDDPRKDDVKKIDVKSDEAVQRAAEEEAWKKAKADVDEAWKKAKATGNIKTYSKAKARQTALPVRRNAKSGWETIRIFVSSPFVDFHQEREILIKKVFVDLQQWCNKRQLHLVVCDLRWGVPENSPPEITFKTCLGEIDSCYEYNVMPFFLHLSGTRVGWIPTQDEVATSIVTEYDWIDGLSVTEMEVVHAALRVKNPNALFMMREIEFEASADEVRQTFYDNPEKLSKDLAEYKCTVLKETLLEAFGSRQTELYRVSCDGTLDTLKKPKLSHLDKHFAPKVCEFFKSQISQQYPDIIDDMGVLENDATSSIKALTNYHELFCKLKASEVETEKTAYDLAKEYIDKEAANYPLFIYGLAGTGKTTRMASWATIMLDRRLKSTKNHRVFCHFVGAVPDSTSKFTLILRLCNFFDIKSFGKLENLIYHKLSKSKEKVVILIDAVNQVKSDATSVSSNWLPRTLGVNVRVVLSMLENSDEHEYFGRKGTYPSSLPLIRLGALTTKAKDAIIESFRQKYAKRLNEQQTRNLLKQKKFAENPLWLSLALEEMRVFGSFEEISKKIKEFPDDLIDMELQILERSENETHRELLIAACSLLEVSKHGMLEWELLDLLGGDESKLLPPLPQFVKNGGEQKTGEKAKGGERLSAFKWAEVFRLLRPFVRPYGNPGQGRLNFYHQSFSKAVRKKYFDVSTFGDSPGPTTSQIYEWWRQKLLKYFEKSDVFDRRLEELPLLLANTKSVKKLQNFALDWQVIDAVYEKGKFCKRLHDIWLDAGGLDVMAEKYQDFADRCLKEWKNSPEAKSGEPGEKTEELAQRLLKLCYLCTDSDKYTQALEIVEKINSVLYGNKLVDEPNPTKVTGIMKQYVGFNASAYENYAYQWDEIKVDQIPHIAKTIYWCQLSVNFNRIIYEKKQTDPCRLELAEALTKLSWNWGEICCMDNDSSLKDANLEGNEQKCRIIFHDAKPKMPRSRDDSCRDCKICEDAKISRRNFHYDTAFHYAMDSVYEAIQIFDELKEIDKKANALISKACLFRDPKEQIKVYLEAERVLNDRGGIGVYHQRLWGNYAIALQEDGKNEQAYNYYKKTYDRSLEVNGRFYPQTRRISEILNETPFKTIAAVRGDDVPPIEDYPKDFALGKNY